MARWVSVVIGVLACAPRPSGFASGAPTGGTDADDLEAFADAWCERNRRTQEPRVVIYNRLPKAGSTTLINLITAKALASRPGRTKLGVVELEKEFWKDRMRESPLLLRYALPVSFAISDDSTNSTVFRAVQKRGTCSHAADSCISTNPTLNMTPKGETDSETHCGLRHFI